ncbi:DUF2535 family protein [Bacillus alkalicellulosilyticus]|uniref:DUF2535 family protein n=1 Tax=Alkalihalobacterium alkalicellulosilyticum TaxID=1912214 RepID=UPI000996779F|nr:hypothetical protein [Bacillus alkalicellulosilyticus]
MVITKCIELFHKNGRKYLIKDIPIFCSELLLLNYYLEMLIDEIEQNCRPKTHYSFHSFIIDKCGPEEFNRMMERKKDRINI